ncbi:MAG TPA: 16S rRNA (cytosine(1402)-N(4))-methyltransferase RsmH [Thermoanaerobaculia bacterium]|nr:16S rRNA (cytosine(1402)-N(4))-methyltransferase RsmH [Thermoanaerobaculia bacterium]
MDKPPHQPVLVREVVEILAPERGGFFVDATVGAGGHARALLESGPGIRLLGLDRDPDALALARGRLAAFGNRVRLAEANFADLGGVLAGSPPPDGILADLGVSSMQLEEPARGFSFRREGPLDMRMSRSGRSAADVVAQASVEELSRIFLEYGEERMAIKIARAILEERSREPITTTRQLSRIVARVKGDREKIDPATRVFQALRIEVNEELQSLSRFLVAAVEKMNAEGRVAVIAYHSLEDRMVKETFRRESGVCFCPPRLPVCVCGARRVLTVLTRRPIRPSDAEVRRNPRSRSARLRAAEKLSGERAAL